MPAKSKAQQQAAAIALHHPSKAKTDMGGMGKAELRKFASTPRKGLPKHVESVARALIEASTSFRGWGGGRGDWHGGRSEKFTRKLSDTEHRREADATDKRHNDWAKEHGVKCTCNAPSGSNHSSMCAIFKGYHARNEGRDDASKLGLGSTGLKFARMNSKEAFKTTDGTDEKWKTSAKLRTELAGEKPGMKMKSTDKVGKVPHAMKGVSERAQQIVTRMLT